MNPIRKFLDTIKPAFTKGGKLGFLHSTFDAFESFAFVPNTTSQSGTHIHDSIDLKRTMTVVIIALLPALLFGMWNVGYQHHLAFGTEATFGGLFWYGFLKVFPIIVVTYVVGLGIEFISAQLRGHEVNEGFLVTGMLIPMIVPPDCPLWMVAVATAFAVIIGKEVFGGTGMNIFNPALIARAFLFFSFPSYFSGDKVYVSGLSANPAAMVDGFSGATALAGAPEGMAQLPPLSDMFFGFMPGVIGSPQVGQILGCVAAVRVASACPV